MPVSPGTHDLWATTDLIDGDDLLAKNLLANTGSSTFEGPVRFKVDPPIWSILDTRAADGFRFGGSS